MKLRSRWLTPTLLLLSAGFFGCTGGDETPPPGGTPTPSQATTPSPTAAATPTTVPSPTPREVLAWNMTFVAYGSLTPLEGVKATVGGEVKYSDAEGRVSFEVERNTTAEVKAEINRYIVTYYNRQFTDFGWDTTYALLSNATVAALGALLGAPFDSSQGIVEVALTEASEAVSYTQTVAGASVDLDAPYDLALVSDASSETGFSNGNTTLEGSLSGVYFVNVAPGSVSLSIDPADSHTCSPVPAGVEVRAGTYTNVSVVCDRR